MAFINIDKKELKELVKILEDSKLSEIKLVEGESRITLSKVAGTVISNVAASPVAPISNEPACVPASKEATEDKADHPGALKSPMVGNVYLKPSPDAESFVKVGSSVNAGDTIVIVEAMKVMNPIKATKSGIIKEICVCDSQPVEFDQVLAIIE